MFEEPAAALASVVPMQQRGENPVVSERDGSRLALEPKLPREGCSSGGRELGVRFPLGSKLFQSTPEKSIESIVSLFLVCAKEKFAKVGSKGGFFAKSSTNRCKDLERHKMWR